MINFCKGSFSFSNLVTFTVGYGQKNNINAAVKKVSLLLHSLYLFLQSSLPLSLSLNLYLQFSENFTILLFHYDNRTSEWDEFEWSRQAIHVSTQKQTKWLAISSFVSLSVLSYSIAFMYFC